MNLKRLLAGYGTVALLLSTLSPALAQVDLGQYAAEGSVEAGGIPQPVPFNDSAKYQEYRDLAQQLIVPQLKLLLGDKDENYYVQFDAINASQKNQMFMLRFGEYGLLDVQAQWVEIPHFFSDGVARTPYDESGGNFALPSRPTGFPSATGTNVRAWVNSTAKPFDMSLLEGIANVNVRYTPTPYLTFSANMNYQNPTGQQPFGGSFILGSDPGLPFNVNELWVPTQYHTYNFGTGVEYTKGGWLIGFQYQGSFFRDAYDTLTWDNPDIAASNLGPNGACTDSAPYSPSAGTGPCRGRAAMYPDNQAHNFIVTGAGQLPLNTRVMANVEYGFWLQDAPFIPFASNSTLAQPLPRTSLGGDVRPFFANLTLDSNPIERLALKATYSYFDYDNETPEITVSGIKSLNDAEVVTPYTATAHPFSFSVQTISFEPTYLLSDTLAAHFNARISSYHNSNLMVLQQDQTSYGPALDWMPYPWLSFRADYQHAHRSSPGYNNNRLSLVQHDAEGIEQPGMRRFDEATVDVNQASLYASVQPVEKLTLFTAFNYDYRNYPSSEFGLQYTSSYSPSVGASWDPLSGVHLFADYAWQAYDWKLRAVDVNEATVTSADTWRSYGRNQANNIDLGMDIAIPQNRILPEPSHLKLQYTYTVANSAIHSAGDLGGGTGPATIFPDTGTRLQELTIQYEYWFNKRVALNIGYYFSHFGQNDFSQDNMANWVPTPGSTMTSFSTFLGNRIWTPYNANVGLITLKYKF